MNLKYIFKRLFFLLFLFYVPLNLKSQSFPSAVAANWSSLGPSNIPGANGRIDFIRYSPNDSNTIWVGSRTGGLWKSTDAGTTWMPKTDNELFIGCYDIAISNSNPDIMYMATGTVGAAGIAFDIGVKKSIDGGLTWNVTGLSFSSCCDRVSKIEINPDDNDVVFAATSDGIYMSIDAGMTWNQTATGNINDLKFKPGNTGVIYATGDGLTQARFLQSLNGGFSFNRITSGLPDSSTDVVGFRIGVTLANPDYVYLIANCQSSSGFNGIYLSTDGGINFSTQNSTSGLIQLNHNADFMCIDVNPTNANDIYIGGLVPYHSDDGGLTWRGTSFPNLSNNFHALKFVPQSSSTIFAVNDGGFYKSNRSDSSWTYLSNGLQVAPIQRMGCSRSNSNLILAGQHGNGILLYDNGSWTHLYEGDGMESIIDPTIPAVMYITSSYGSVSKSINGGANFSQIVFTDSTGVNSNGNILSPFIMHPSDNNSLLIGKHEVYRSIDGGNAWNAIAGLSDSMPVVALAYAPSDPNYIYAATNNNFYVCTDGNNFTQRIYSFPGSISSIAVSSSDPEKVWITMWGFAGGNGVYVSTDAGLTWNDYSLGLPNLPVNCIAYQDSSEDALYVGTDVGVYYRSDLFSDWQYFSNNLPNVQVRELEIQYGINKIRAATFGRGLWESDMVLTTGIDQISIDENHLRIIPNPSSGNFVVNFNKLFVTQEMKIEIYDSFGKIVSEEKIQNENTNFEMNLPAGVYLAKIVGAEKVYSSKIIVH